MINISHPAFVHAPATVPASPDFRLTAQSPAINKGLNLYASGVRTDLLGVARPQTGPFELGAYEYGGTTPPPPSFDFALANGGNKTVTRGGSVANSLTASLISGTAQAVSFSISGLPSGVTGGFSPGSCTPHCSSTLTLSASASAATGTATVTVTASGAGISRTSAFTLTTTAGNGTDLNGDGITNVADVQIAVNQASG
ncbi:MAG: choice-of-anchor Q domain-containing protein, partial [Elusimicrobiota bacterium]